MQLAGLPPSVGATVAFSSAQLLPATCCREMLASCRDEARAQLNEIVVGSYVPPAVHTC